MFVKYILIIFANIFILINVFAQNILYDRKLYDIAKNKNKNYIGGYINAFTSLNTFDEFFGEIGLIFQSNLIANTKFYFESEFKPTENIYTLQQFNFTKHFKNKYLKVGIISPNIGNFNLNHILAEKQFLTKPTSINLLTPNLFGDLGFAIGSNFKTKENLLINFEIAMVQGLNENVIFNNTGKVNLNEGKDKYNNFTDFKNVFKDNNNDLLFVTNLSFEEENIYKIGATFLRGNCLENNNNEQKCIINTLVFDLNLNFGKLNNQNELVYNFINLPASLNELLAKKQVGFYSTFSYPIYKINEKSYLNIAYRLSFADVNVGYFESTLQNIEDTFLSNSFGLDYNLNQKISLKLNFNSIKSVDIIGNLPIVQNQFNFGVSSWF